MSPESMKLPSLYDVVLDVCFRKMSAVAKA